jgi:hypothetical protein
MNVPRLSLGGVNSHEADSIEIPPLCLTDSLFDTESVKSLNRCQSLEYARNASCAHTTSSLACASARPIADHLGRSRPASPRPTFRCSSAARSLKATRASARSRTLRLWPPTDSANVESQGGLESGKTQTFQAT